MDLEGAKKAGPKIFLPDPSSTPTTLRTSDSPKELNLATRAPSSLLQFRLQVSQAVFIKLQKQKF